MIAVLPCFFPAIGSTSKRPIKAYLDLKDKAGAQRPWLKDETSVGRVPFMKQGSFE